MDFFLSNDPLLVQKPDVPPRYYRNYMPFSRADYRRYESGELLVQLISGSGFQIELIHAWMSATGVLEIRPSFPASSLFFMLCGELSVGSFSGLSLRFEQHTYRPVFWERSMTFEAALGKGHYSFFILSFPDGNPGSVAFQPGMLERTTVEELYTRRVFPLHLQMKEVIQDIQRTVRNWNQRYLLVESGVRQLLNLFLEAYERREDEDRIDMGYRGEILHLMEEFIESHLDEGLSVELLARKVMRSRAWLQRMTQRHFNKGVYELVREKRMQEASRLLLHSVLPVSEIATRVSDMTISAFSATFRKYFGLSPRDYRKQGGRMQQ